MSAVCKPPISRAAAWGVITCLSLPKGASIVTSVTLTRGGFLTYGRYCWRTSARGSRQRPLQDHAHGRRPVKLRFHDSAIRRLVALLPNGTPIEIR